MAAPGKRDREDSEAWVKARVAKKDTFGRPKTTTEKAKGKWYKPVTADMRRRGARKRSMRAQDAHELATLPKRQLKMNLPDGASELLGLGNGIYEQKETSYIDEEYKLFEINQGMRDLLKDLEQRDDVEA